MNHSPIPIRYDIHIYAYLSPLSQNNKNCLRAHLTIFNPNIENERAKE